MSLLVGAVVVTALVQPTAGGSVAGASGVLGAQSAPDLVLTGTLVFHAEGPGANGDGLVNALLFPGLVAGTVGSAQEGFGLVGGLFGPLVGLDPEATAAEIQSGYPDGRLPIDARYDARIDFRLEETDDLHFELVDGVIDWSSDSTSSLSYEGGSITDSFHGRGSERLDPATSRIVVDLDVDDQGRVTGYTFDAEVRHAYLSEGTSVWEVPDVARITVGRRGDDMLLEAETPFGSASALGMPPVIEGVFSDDTWTVSWSSQGPVDDLSRPVMFTDGFTNSAGGSVSVEVSSELGDCAPRILLPVYDQRLAFDDAGLLDIEAELTGVPDELSDRVRWVFAPPGFDVSFDPPDAVGTRVTITVLATPPDNAAFGEQELSVEYVDEGAAATCAPIPPVRVRLFFDRDATTNPDGTWNWFHFWLQTPADADVDSIAPGTSCNRRFGYYPYGDDSIYVCPEAATSDQLVMNGAKVTFIDVMAVTVLHEDQHRRAWRQWGSKPRCGDTDGDGIPDPAEGCIVDVDGDRVPDDVEPTLTPASRPLDPLRSNSCYDVRGVYLADLDDEHCLAYAAELAWPIDAVDGEDWAHPGSQWP